MARRRKKPRIKVDAMSLAPIPRREPSGRPQREPQDRDASIVTLTMRCHQMGLAPTPENIRDMRAPWWGRIFGALMRHMWAWWAGQKTDPESGLPHLHHAACCIAFLMAYESRQIGTDDRWKL